MRRWLIPAAIVFGLVGVLLATVAVGDRDNTGETVRASRWASDVCGVTSSWEGELQTLRDQVGLGNFGDRRNDGGSGDSVQETITARTAIDRAISATEETLQRGLERAGIPDVNRGQAASQILRSWALETEGALRVVENQLDKDPKSPSDAFAALSAPVHTLARSAVSGRVAFRSVAALDAELASALDDSGNCQRLKEDRA